MIPITEEHHRPGWPDFIADGYAQPESGYIHTDRLWYGPPSLVEEFHLDYTMACNDLGAGQAGNYTMEYLFRCCGCTFHVFYGFLNYPSHYQLEGDMLGPVLVDGLPSAAEPHEERSVWREARRDHRQDVWWSGWMGKGELQDQHIFARDGNELIEVLSDSFGSLPLWPPLDY